MIPTKSDFVLAIHGGAGVIERARMAQDMERAYRSGLEASLAAGRDVLAAGGSSLDAVVTAVSVMEDDPLFNAGRGGMIVLDRSGNVAMPFNSPGMYRGYVKGDGTTAVDIF